jgi:hypothetical protein
LPPHLDTHLKPRHNLWLGVSVENQKAAEERIPLLLQVPAAVRFLSVEPLLSAVNLERYLTPVIDEALDCPAGEERAFFRGRWPGIDWVIVGGESGPNARECNVAWIDSIVAQCRAASVPCFVKQLGSRPVSPECLCPIECGCGLHHGFRDSKGGDMAEWPSDLRVREFPRTEAAHA